MTTATIAYRPHRLQQQIHDAWQVPNRVVVAGRQSGKTVAIVNEEAVWAMSAPKRWPDDPRPQFWWVTASYKTKGKAWRDFVQYIPADIIRAKSEAESWIELKNGSRITMRSADGAEGLVSERLHGLVCDEFAQYKPEVYDQYLAPMLATTGGPVIHLGTPRGRNHAYVKFQRGVNGEKGWQSFHWRTEDSPYVAKDWLADRRAETPERLWRQEYLAEFLEDGGEVFRNIDACIQPHGERNDYTVIGLDLARSHDFTVAWAINSGGQWLEWQRIGHYEWAVQRTLIVDMYRRLKAHRLVMDATGMHVGADAVVDDLRSEGCNVDPVKLTGEEKRAVVQHLMLRFDMQSLTIPVDAAEEFRDYTAEKLSSGYDRYSAPEGKYDDAVIACALAMWGVRAFKAVPAIYQPKTELQEIFEREMRQAGDQSIWTPGMEMRESGL